MSCLRRCTTICKSKGFYRTWWMSMFAMVLLYVCLSLGGISLWQWGVEKGWTRVAC